MNRWVRIVLAGALAGVVWYLASAATLSLFAQPFLDWVRSPAAGLRWRGTIWFALDLAMGIWAVWLYSVIESRAGRFRLRGALTAGLAWWIIKTLQSAKWAGLGLIPQEVLLAPLLSSLLCSLVAATVGAWLYTPRTR